MYISFNGSVGAAHRFDYAWAFREVKLQSGRLPNSGSRDTLQRTASTNVGLLEFNSLVRLQG